jgi:hypothetical protein
MERASNFITRYYLALFRYTMIMIWVSWVFRSFPRCTPTYTQMEIELDYIEFPVEYKALRRVQAILRKSDVLVPSFQCSAKVLYDPLTYLGENLDFGTQTALLADRNLVTRWMSTVRGEPISHQHRLAAAVIAFAICSEIMIEPSMALYEPAWDTGNDEANAELLQFRIADNIHPSYWVDLAIGKATDIRQGISDAPTNPGSEHVNFSQPLRRWRINYVFALKIAELELQEGNSERKMASLLRWIYDEFLFSASGIVLAAYYLAPNSPRKRLFKSLRSPDRDRAIAGVRNQTWDITLLTDWIKALEETRTRNRITLLASLDRNLLKLATLLMNAKSSDPSNLGFGSAFCTIWGQSAGERLTKIAQEYWGDRDNPGRALNRSPKPTSISEMIAEGEKRLRDWQPT